ncbi:hypothetical protein PRUB_a0107 [Pseudoalteromonas rubra]|uniref:Uncharacterized protein n=1 Tax=Pseudoalteromonas rubra TaxID=43658 RepID=A0A8T0C4V3_9GAMM|nr:hypothetical protein PRUB_a0107 [Pseudoalteromonas rubra]
MRDKEAKMTVQAALYVARAYKKCNEASGLTALYDLDFSCKT